MEKVSEFNFVGQLLGFVIKDGYKIKYLRMSHGEREYWIKPTKEVRKSLDPRIQPGCSLEISGIREESSKNGKVKLKAYSVNLVQINECPLKAAANIPGKKKKCAGSILVCQKSTCQKKGGSALTQVLKESIRHHGLEDQIQVKMTGCLKKCKQGPNLVMLPDKARYTQVKPEEVSALLGKHFSGSEG